MHPANLHKIYARYNDDTIRVYQAYGDAIANEALQKGTFGDSFKLERMTWIKPSFLWMMYRSGWGTKEGQTRVLAIDMKRTGFDEILSQAVQSSFSKEAYSTREEWQKAIAHSDVRCQWDPERDIHGNPLERRSIQLGLRGLVVRRYVNDWIVKITDYTQTVMELREKIYNRTFDDRLLPVETEYPVKQID